MVETSIRPAFADSSPLPPRARRLNGAAPFGLLILLLGLLAPDCCLNGSHAFGAGMDAFGPICHGAS